MAISPPPLELELPPLPLALPLWLMSVEPLPLAVVLAPLPLLALPEPLLLLVPAAAPALWSVELLELLELGEVLWPEVDPIEPLVEADP